VRMRRGNRDTPREEVDEEDERKRQKLKEKD
jgi:hypothetical protein